MSDSFAKQLKVWQGRMYQKEAADALDVPLRTFRSWIRGKRTPNKLALAEVQRRMASIKKTVIERTVI